MAYFNLPFIPERESKPRKTGLTMVMDKGLSVREAEDMVSIAGDYIDFVKFGFGTSAITKPLKEKIAIYKQANIRPYFGGTLFEVFLARGMFNEFRKLLDEYSLDLAEISDGTLPIEHGEKCNFIQQLSNQLTVISEVGSKLANVEIPNDQWIAMMKAELEAGSWKVIAEARESGNIGIYNSDHSANTELIDGITHNVKNENVIWEAPIKSQQAWFIKLLGTNVNLGNIAPTEVISLETLRLGLRGDTFFQYLPKE